MLRHYGVISYDPVLSLLTYEDAETAAGPAVFTSQIALAFTLASSGVGACAALAASHAAAMPTLSFSSTMIRSAVFLPMPLVFASSPKRPSADYPTAISTEAETRYVGEVRAFILDLLIDMTGLSFLAALGCRFAIGALDKKKPRGTHDE